MVSADTIGIRKASTKRRHIYDVLHGKILTRELDGGVELPSTHEFARKFGVSYFTTQSAMDDLVRDGLLVRHRGKGTFVSDASPANGKARPTTSRLVLVLPRRADILAYGAGEETAQIVAGGSHGAERCGAEFGIVSVPSVMSAEEVRAAIPRLLRHDGAMFWGFQYRELMQALQARQFPIVALYTEPGTSGVCVDRERAARESVMHLVAHGYRKIGYFGSMTVETMGRVEAYREALVRSGLVAEPSWMWDPFRRGGVQEAAAAYVALDPRPEAVFTDHAVKAVALVAAASKRGLRVPEDLAVLAFGADTAMARESQIATMAIPFEAMVGEAVGMLDRLVKGALLPPVQKTLAAQLVSRRSCGCAAAASAGTDMTAAWEADSSAAERGAQGVEEGKLVADTRDEPSEDAKQTADEKGVTT